MTGSLDRARQGWAGDVNSDSTDDDALPRVLELLWHESPPARRSGLSRERIVAAGNATADADGLGALSMARLAERLGCGTMSLYRHVASEGELGGVMLSGDPGPPPSTR